MKILIIRLSSLGDIVLTQPVAASLRQHYPQATIHFITKKIFIPIVESFGCIDQTHIWEDHKSFSKLRKLRRSKFDLVIDLHNKFNTFLIKSLVKGKQTFTYNKKHNLRRKIVKHKTNETISSTVDLYFSTLRKLGIDAKTEYPRLFPEPAENETILKIRQNGKILVGIFPGALHKTKQYPLQQLAKVILNSAEIFQFVLLGSNNEKSLAETLINLSKSNVLNFCGKFSIDELISVINSLDIIITNDSGPMHIAAALKKKQIAIFGATHPILGFAPHNEKAIIIKADLDCQPCSLHGSEICPLEHFNCMKDINSDKIIKAINLFIR